MIKDIHNIQHASTGNSFFHDLILKCIITVLVGCKKSVEGLPGGASGKDSICQCKRPRFNPWSGRSPGGGNGNPLQYSCLENPMDKGGWWASVHGISKNQTWLCTRARAHTHTHTHTHTHSVERRGGWERPRASTTRRLTHWIWKWKSQDTTMELCFWRMCR